MQTIKCVSVGDGGVGKTCMLIRFSGKYFPGEYIPTVFDNYASTVEAADGRKIRLELWDTAGQENYVRLRTLSYPLTDVFLLCFAVSSPSSYVNAEIKWVYELNHFSKNSKVILVGTKTDLRQDQATINYLKSTNEAPISYADGVQMAKKIGAVRYLECSAFTGTGITDIFNAVIETVLSASNKVKGRKMRCSIL